MKGTSKQRASQIAAPANAVGYDKKNKQGGIKLQLDSRASQRDLANEALMRQPSRLFKTASPLHQEI